MGRFFLLTSLIVLLLAFLLFFPIIVQSSLHYDINDKKAGFSVRLFKIFPVFGGYIQTYSGGLALHISQKKAVLIPYEKMDSERKRFSFVKTFRLLAVSLTTETGAEYFLPVSIAQTIIQTLFRHRLQQLENSVWLTNGDVLRFSLRSATYFNTFILIKNFISFIKEKIKGLWQKKNKKLAP